MNQAGPFNPAFGVESFGLKDLKSISCNLQAPRLVEDAIHTGRSPNDEFAVPDAVTEKTVWWDNNKAMTPQAFETLDADMLAHAKGMQL